MDNIFKQCILLIILSIAAMFLQAQLAHVLHVFLYVHNWIANLMSGLFAGSTIGMIIQGIVALVLVPVACGAFVALIFWLVKHVSMPHTMAVIWTVRLTMSVTILAKAA